MFSKTLMRIFASYSIGFYIITNFVNSINIFLNKNFIGVICLIFFFISIFGLWFYMFYNWGTSQFKSIGFKRLWFFVLLLGLFVGGWLYYLIVYEFKRTLNATKTSN